MIVSRHALYCVLLLALPSLIVRGQESGNRYQALQQALGLSDSQLSQLQLAPKGSQHVRILNATQRTKLAAIEKVLGRGDMESLAVSAGLIDGQKWPGPPLCYYPVAIFASELDLNESQIWQLERLRQDTPTKSGRDLKLAVLNDAQKAKLAAFETALDLVGQAVELGLTPYRLGGEMLCH